MKANTQCVSEPRDWPRARTRLGKISEIFPNRVRARGQSLGSLTHWVFAFITTYAFPVLTDKLGGGCAFGIFFLAMVGQLFWVLKVMPETKGIPLEEMEEKLGLTND